MDIDLGELTIGALSDWVAGIATAAGVIFALTVSLRQERQHNERRMHAVYVWPEQSDVDNRWSIQARNGTDYPIYEWVLRAEWIAPDGTAARELLDSGSQGILRPGPTPFEDWVPRIPLPTSESEVRTSITFTDVRGKRMTRLHTGKLVRE